MLQGSRRRDEDDAWIVAVDDGQVVGAAMHTPPYHLFLPRLPKGVAARIALTLVESGRPVPGVNGEAGAVAEFVKAWSRRTGGSSSVLMRQRLWRLQKLVPRKATSGNARIAAEEDRRLLIDWLESFLAEATSNQPGDSADALLERRLAAGELLLWWDEGQPVSLGGHSAAAAGVARVGPVYTPPEHRCHGYGSAVAVAATEEALRAGAQHVAGYTDLANSTYQAIGYVPDHDSEERWLILPPLQ
jgi:predicted GNAT family acetyltransferase